MTPTEGDDGLCLNASKRPSAEAMKAGAVMLQPFLRAVGFRKQAMRDFPEGGRMIHVDEMRDFMRGEIVEHERRREDQPPGKIERPRRRA